MKKFLFIAIATIAFGPSAFAQDTTGAAKVKALGIKTYDDAWAKISQALNLTPTETTGIQQMNQTYAPQYKAILTNSSLTTTEKETQTASLHTQQEASLKKIVTPVQYAEWTAIKKQVIAAAQSKASSMASTGTTSTHTTHTTITPVRKQ